MKSTSKYTSVKRYAEFCGVSRQTIYNWIKNNLIVAEKKDYGWIIDETKSGFRPRKSGGRKNIDSHITKEISDLNAA